jgi:hypothetical protein
MILIAGLMICSTLSPIPRSFWSGVGSGGGDFGGGGGDFS